MKKSFLLFIKIALLPFLSYSILATAATTHVSCLITYEDGGKKIENTVSWDDNDVNQIISYGAIVNRNTKPDKLVHFGPSPIQWQTQYKDSDDVFIDSIDRTTGLYESVHYLADGRNSIFARGTCRPASQGNKF